MEVWKSKEGGVVLRELGIKSGQKIIDFGFGTGIYSIIASKIIGDTGKIYAIDKDPDAIEDLKSKLKEKEIKNIEIIHLPNKILIPLQDKSIDVFLIYDVFHLLDRKEKDQLIEEAFRLLKDDGFISYHATHLEKKEISLEKIKAIMNNHSFLLKESFKKRMFHWSWIEEGLVMNFHKN